MLVLVLKSVFSVSVKKAEATAQQLASYQLLQKLPGSVRGDVYCRAPGQHSDRFYFVGKVTSKALQTYKVSRNFTEKKHIKLTRRDPN